MRHAINNETFGLPVGHGFLLLVDRHLVFAFSVVIFIRVWNDAIEAKLWQRYA
jgi:hypothetical protein